MFTNVNLSLNTDEQQQLRRM